MSKLTASYEFDRVKPEEMPRILELFGEQVTTTVNGQLDFFTNFNCKALTITFGAANVDVSAIHGLGRVPVGYLVYSRNASMVVYDGSVEWSASLLSLRASAAGTAKLIVF